MYRRIANIAFGVALALLLIIQLLLTAAGGSVWLYAMVAATGVVSLLLTANRRLRWLSACLIGIAVILGVRDFYGGQAFRSVTDALRLRAEPGVFQTDQGKIDR